MEYKRRDIVNIVNDLSSNYPCKDFDFDLRQCYTDILTYCTTNKKRPSTLKISINNGFLYIGGVKINRVVYKINNYNPFNSLPRDNEIDFEALILARQSSYDC